MISWGSNVVNGQLVWQPPTSAFFPMTYGAQYRGPGYWPRQGTFQVPPVIPAAAYSNQMSPNALGTDAQNYQGGGLGDNDRKTLFHPTQGTIVFALIALILGLFGLHYIHYGAE